MPGNDSFTKVLLHFDGTNGSTTITDDNAGGSAKTWTAAGSAALSTTSPKFGTAQLALASATSDRITTPSHADFNALGTTPFVVDAWVKTSTSGSRMIGSGVIDSGGSNAAISFLLQRDAANTVSLIVASGGTLFTATNAATIHDGNWHHIAGIGSGSNIYCAVDGTVSAGTAYTSINSTTDTLAVGRAGALSALYWNGNIDEYRLSVGTDRGWTSNFTPLAIAYDRIQRFYFQRRTRFFRRAF